LIISQVAPEIIGDFKQRNLVLALSFFESATG
jgi:hypothetical protein